MRREFKRRHLLLGGLGAALPLPAIAQGDYPSRAVRVVIGFPPGGGVDTIGRPTFQRLSQRLGQQVVIDNRAGNNGNIAMDHVTKSAPDGYTLFFGNVGNYTTQALFPNPGFDTLRDFAFISRVTLGPLAIAVPADFPARTLQELLDIARRRPGELNFGSGGSGGVPHFAFEILVRRTGVDIVHVPYRGSGPALQDLLGGRVQMMVDGYGLMRGAHEAGRIRVLAMTSRQRHPNLPDVPTVDEAGVPGYEFTSWNALAAPVATSPAILQRLEDAMRWTMENTDLPQTLLGFGTFPAFAPGAEVRETLVKDREIWTRIAREANIRAE
ncbi:MAG: tripartite tricarboxylate transporter substrate binding protein [Roseomonas sp.]|nr:tripartite tricarboxylate transporter substrate binding protein [Roseomonas sp.]MCA3382018.1 tripartite tricarboxylate transporter substrate binding protein [Roseomonas sp.]